MPTLENDTNFKIRTKEKRIFHHIKSEHSGPIVVFFAGIHGNEKAGVNALNQLFKHYNTSDFKGEIFGVIGNIKALNKNKRYLTSDLNRMWTTVHFEALKRKDVLNSEQEEQQELFGFIETLFAQHKDEPIYFIDLHTTSSKTLPFITINDALINRNFSYCFPVPVVLGIEEYLEGPLLSYLNKLGYVSLGFEAGQHTDPEAIQNCEAFIYLVLHHSGNLIQTSEATLKQYEAELKAAAKDISSTFEVVFKHQIEPEDNFKMLEGFKSFQDIKKGTPLARSNNLEIVANYNAQLFMPLYQNDGDDGFFIIKRIPKVFLKLSEVLRKIKADSLLTWLPGISWQDKPNGVLKANLSIARFLTKSIFHLFGYRNKQLNETQLLLYNRERVAKKYLYQAASWYHKKETV